MNTLVALVNPYEQTKHYMIEDEQGLHETGWGYFPYPRSEWLTYRMLEQGKAAAKSKSSG